MFRARRALLKGLLLTGGLTVVAGCVVAAFVLVWGSLMGLVPDGYSSLSASRLALDAAWFGLVVGLVVTAVATVRAWSVVPRTPAGTGTDRDMPAVVRFVRAEP